MKYETCKFSKLKRVEQPESIRLLPNSPRAGRRFFVKISIPAIDGPAVDGLVSWSNRYKIQNITKAWRDRRPTNRTILERRKVRYNFYRDGKV